MFGRTIDVTLGSQTVHVHNPPKGGAPDPLTHPPDIPEKPGVHLAGHTPRPPARYNEPMRLPNMDPIDAGLASQLLRWMIITLAAIAAGSCALQLLP